MKSNLYIIKDYTSKLNIVDTEIGIKLVKDTFEDNLAKSLSLLRVSAPLFIEPSTGLNDNLSGAERPVSFDILNIPKTNAEIVHSLAKWKRLALKRYNLKKGCGLYTDMNAIRRDEEFSNIHSLYVDQWDWEKVIDKESRNLNTLKDTVKKIVTALKDAKTKLKEKFHTLTLDIKEEVFFITSQQLYDLYPTLTPKDREHKICEEKGTVCIIAIGDTLNNGEKHDGRAPDYDDWELNCDILLWYEPLKRSIEISSMGIRVDKNSMDSQLKKANCDNRRELPFHKMILNDELPLTIGGGIGQSRICMILLEKAHIGEVQVSLWPKEMLLECEQNNIFLL